MSTPRGGWMAQFPDPQSVLDAARHLRRLGYRDLEIYSPYPLEEADEVLSLGRPKLLRGVAAAGFSAAALGYFIMWYANAWDYPLNVGGRPVHPIPAFVPITFESGILAAGVCAFVLALVSTKLLRLWRPEFEVENFESTSIDRFWLAIDAGDPRFETDSARTDLEALNPLAVAAFGDTP